MTHRKAVLSALTSSGRALSGAELAGQTKLGSGTLYPLLLRMEQEALLESQWEETSKPGPRRRLYSLTAYGEQAAARTD